MNNESIRKAFENWYLGLHGSTKGHLDRVQKASLHFAKGDYYDLGARMMWLAYQAAHEQQQKEIDRLRGLFERVKKIAEFPPQDKAILKVADEALEQGDGNE